MSENTTNLDLFKYNPVTDGASTFNIDLGLNNNWDKIDVAVADCAQKNGDNNEIFNVANATSDNHAVNKGQLNSLILPTTPYSVNSGNQDTNGYADFIDKISGVETSVTFKINGSYPLIALTFPNGNPYLVSYIPNITSINDNGLYTFIIEESCLTSNGDGTHSTTALATTKTITESLIAPLSPSNGDYWLNIGVKPYKPYKYNGSSWIETQFVKLGQVEKLSGILGTPISYSFNAWTYISIAGEAGNQFTQINHNLGYDLFVTTIDYEDISNGRNVKMGLSNAYTIETSRGIWVTDSSTVQANFSKSIEGSSVIFYARNGVMTNSNSGNFLILMKRRF